MYTRLVRLQLVAFAVVTALALTTMALNYVKIPAQLGVGRYDVTVQLDDAAGLYPKSHVTYRGVEVGQVTKIDLRPGGGAVAHLQIEDGADIPAASTALVRSASVIGEQYVDFVPSTTSGDRMLAQGDEVAVAQTVLPTTTNEVLDSVDALLTSIPADDLTTTLDELGAAFDGSGDDLGALIDSASGLVESANENLPQTLSLIENAAPVLQTQVDTNDSLRSSISNLDSITRELQASTGDLRTIFTGSQEFLTQIDLFGQRLNPIFGTVLSDAATAGQVTDAYLPGIEHVLTLFPALETAFQAAVPVAREDDDNPEINLWFKLGFDPPVCDQGFADRNNYQDPDSKEKLPIASDSYCKVAKSSPLAVRGARNALCPDGVTRAAYAADCGLVFDRAAVDVQNRTRKNGAAVADTPGSEMIMPDGTFFLLDKQSARPRAETWQDLLTGGLGS